MVSLFSFPRKKTPVLGMVHWLVLLGSAGGTLLALALGVMTPDWFGEGRYLTYPLPLGDAMPEMDTTLSPEMRSTASTEAGKQVVKDWSEQQLPNWYHHGKGTAPRMLLTKFAEKTDLENANQYLCSIVPWSGAGSTWTLHHGDYDFTLVTLTTILYMFGNEPAIMYPETREHLLNVLLNQEGGRPLVTAPRTLGLILDTENHHLMTEGSRYLKNQWLATYGTEEERSNPHYNNKENGLEAWLIAYLEEMLHEGVYEFNSRPYIGYTLQALLNLEAYPETPQIRNLARYLLDVINLQYALGSLDLRRYPPFRRQYVKEKEREMDNDSHTAYMHVWTGGNDGKAGHYSSFMLLAELLPYRLPDDLRTWTLSKPEPYFVRYGRGASACAELYSGGPGYLLSAGGANRGWRSRIVARPITLMLEDGETNVQNCFHIPGRGHWRHWNNSGVYRHFAMANAPVVVPENQKAVAAGQGWQLFRPLESSAMMVAVFTGENFGIIALFPETEETPESLLAALQHQNPDSETLGTRFTWPNGNILEYDPDAPKGTWVMKAENGIELDRNYDAWPQISGDVPALSFARKTS
jgi:hypothetical protein